MKKLLDDVLERRAYDIAMKISPHLPARGHVLDIGSGTGHNAQALRKGTALEFTETDVVDMSVVGKGPVLFDGYTLPFADGAFCGSLLLFVLHYSRNPRLLLREVKRVTSGRILVLQSTYTGQCGSFALRANEWLWGPVAFHVARVVRLVGECRCSLHCHCFFTRSALCEVFADAGLRVHHLEAQPWRSLPVSRDLFVLERSDS